MLPRRRAAVGYLIGFVIAFVGVVALLVVTRHSIRSNSVHGNAALQAAIAKAGNGETIRVAAGNYGVIKLADRAWTTPVTIRGSSPKTVHLAGITLQRVHGFMVDNVDVSGDVKATQSTNLRFSNSHFARGVQLRSGIDNVQVDHNRIDGGTYGVWIYNAPGEPRNRDVTVSRNNISGQAEDNIQVGSCDGLIVDGNVLHDIHDTAAHQDGVQLMGGDHAIIRRNQFWNQDEAIILKAEPVLGPGTRVSNTLVENNVSHNERGAGFIVAGTADTSIANNTAADNRYADVHIEGVNTNLRVWNNVIHQIFAGGTIGPSYEDHNCVIEGGKGPNDVKATPTFAADTDFKLEVGDRCATAATTENAPADDLSHSPRYQPTTAGAWQSVG